MDFIISVTNLLTKVTKWIVLLENWILYKNSHAYLRTTKIQ